MKDRKLDKVFLRGISNKSEKRKAITADDIDHLIALAPAGFSQWGFGVSSAWARSDYDAIIRYARTAWIYGDYRLVEDMPVPTKKARQRKSTKLRPLENWSRDTYDSTVTLTLDGEEHTVTISSGAGDTVDVWIEGAEDDKGVQVLVYGERRGLQYCGLQRFTFGNESTLGEYGEMFLQYSHQIEDILGPRGLDLTTRTKVRRLSYYLPC